MMLFVILLSIVLILVFIQSVIRLLIFGFIRLTSELESDIRDTVDWNGKRLAHFNTEKSKIVLVDRPNNSIAIDVGMDEFILEINSSFKILGLPFSSELDWGSYIDSIVKTVSKKIETLNSCMKFLSPQVAFCFFKPTIRPCMRHCFHVSAGASRCLVEKY